MQQQQQQYHPPSLDCDKETERREEEKEEEGFSFSFFKKKGQQHANAHFPSLTNEKKFEKYVLNFGTKSPAEFMGKLCARNEQKNESVARYLDREDWEKPEPIIDSALQKEAAAEELREDLFYRVFLSHFFFCAKSRVQRNSSKIQE